MTFEPTIDTVEGYRVFDVAGGSLESIGVGYTWAPGWNEAECAVGGKHEPPAPGCRCGFWVYRTTIRALAQFDGILGVEVDRTGYGDFHGPTGVVLTRVQIAGRIIVGADGYRAQRAGIVVIYTDEPELMVPTAAHYGVRVEAMPEIDWPVQGLLVDLDAGRLRVLVLDGEHKWDVEDFRIEKGSAVHLEAMAAAEAEVEVTFERRGDERWVTRIAVLHQEGEK